VLAPHEENMPNLYPSRKSDAGLYVMEVNLAPQERSEVAA
jgi:hypothetical protein